MWTTASLGKQAGWTRIDYNIFVILFRWKWGRGRRAPKGLLNPVGPLYRLVAQITLPLHMLLLSNTMEPQTQTLQSSLFPIVSNVTCLRNVFIRSDHYQTISVLWGLKNRYSYAPSFTSHALLGRWRVFFCGRFLGIFPQTHESFGLLTHLVWSVWFWAGRYD